MQMPWILQSAVERELEGCPAQAVRAAALDLSRRYRESGRAPDGAHLARSEEEVRAYAAFRMPATYAAVSRALEIAREAGLPGAQTLTDVGSGSGSAFWAVRQAFPALAQARLLERDFGIEDDYISELSFEAPRIGFECGAVLEPVAAENKNHPVSFGFGLVLEFAGFTYYLSGDTDVLVDNVQCDVLFVVCDGIWNMPDYEKSVPAQVAAMDVLPGLVVPYHYGVDAPSTKENGARLCAALTAAGIPCREWKKGLF